jgi:lipid II isoglutaminyl synthase (glutamine-hydrolysing)
LAQFTAKGGYVVAIGSSGSLLAQKTIRIDGSVFAGLSFLPMNCRERANVYGDDIWYSLRDNPQMEIIGNQIQILDTEMEQEGQAYGQIIYGHGNNGRKDEGCRKDNIIFTNTLGPLFVKNPHLTEAILADMAKKKNISKFSWLSKEETDYEDNSATLIKRFIRKKRA